MPISDSQRLMARRVLGNTAGKLLHRGSKGVTVRALQAFLADQGYDVGRLDGNFGKRTQAALKAFQKAIGITADGKAGSHTFGRVREMMPEMAEAVASADLPPTGAIEPEPIPELATGVPPEASMQGVSSPPVSASQPPLPPTFDDAMFQPAMPDLPKQYGEAERSDGLASLIDQARSAMTGVPQANLAAARRMEAPEEWQPQAGDGLDRLRAALLGKINMQNEPPQVASGNPDLIRALLGR